MRRETTGGRDRAAVPVRGFRRGSRRGIVLGLLAAVAAIALPLGVSSGVAVASAGSVPAEVSAFVADGLVSQLDEYFGPAADGSGIVFDETTEFGAVYRVFSWSPDFLAGVKTEHPVEMLNEWITVVSLQGAAIGVATISIEPSSVKPELVDFRRSAVLATALRDVPDAATLIREDATSAWFALTDGELVPLVSGSSGVAAATPIADYQRAIVKPPQPAAEPQFGPGFVLPALAIGVIVVLLVVFLLLPGRRRAVTDGVEVDGAEVEVDRPEADASEVGHAETDTDSAGDSGQREDAAKDAPTAEPAHNAKPTARPTPEPSSIAEPTPMAGLASSAELKPAVAKKTPTAKKPAVAKKTAIAPSADAPVRKPAAKQPTVSTATSGSAAGEKLAEKVAKKTPAKPAATPADPVPSDTKTPANATTKAPAKTTTKPPAKTPAEKASPAKPAPAKRPSPPRP